MSALSAFAKRIVKNSVFSVLDQGLALVLGMVFTVLLARFYGPESLGRYAVVIAIASIISAVTNFGVQTTIKRSVASKPKNALFYFRQAMFVRVFLSLPTSFLICAFLISILQYGFADSWLLLSANLYVFGTGVLLLTTGVLTSIHRSDTVLCVNFLSKTIIIVALSTGLVVTVPIELMVQFIAVLALLVAAAAAWVTKREVRSVSHCAISRTKKAYLVRLVLTSMPLSLVAVAEYLNLKVDVLLLSALDSSESVGLYSAAFQILLALVMVPLALIRVFFPNFVQIVGSISVRKIKRIVRIYVMCFILYAIIAIIAIVPASEWLVTHLYDDKFLFSAGALQYLMFGLPVIILNRLFNYVIVAMKKNREFLVITLIGVSINVVLNILLIPEYSFRGAAIATIISEFCVLLGGVLVYRMQLSEISIRSDGRT